MARRFSGGRIAIDVRADWTGAQLAFHDLRNRVSDARKPLKESLYRFMETSVRKRFAAGGIPRWRKRTKEPGYPILDNTGRLKRSVTLRTSPNKRVIHPNKRSAILQTKVPYAPYHDKPRGYVPPNARIPGRPFLYFTQEDITKMKEYLREWTYEQAQRSGLATGARAGD